MNRNASIPARWRSALLGMTMAALVAGCGGGDVGMNTGVALYTTAPAGLTMTVGESATFTAGGGTPRYTVTTSDASIATVTMSGVDFTIKAKAAGLGSIVVNDAVGASFTVPLTVK